VGFLHPRSRGCRPERGTGQGDAQSDGEASRYAVLGVRGCNRAAIATLARVFGRSEYRDDALVGRWRQIFVVAVNCTEPGGLCFSASMGTGPAVGPGHDLALAERLTGDAPSYLVDVGSQEGGDVLAAVPHRPASSDEISCARADVEAASLKMGRQMPDTDLRELLIRSCESPRWDEVAIRCLTCGNCTMVCPTCFLHQHRRRQRPHR
jgi:hypothetical protein